MSAPPDPDAVRRRRRRRRFCGVMLAAVVVAGWLFKPSAEQWRASGVWYLADGGEVVEFRLRWWGRATYSDSSDAVALRWSVERGRLALRSRVDDSLWGSMLRVLQGRPVYDDPESYFYRLGPRGMELTDADGDFAAWLCRTPAAALEAAEWAADPPAPEENELRMTAAAAALGGPLWEMRHVPYTTAVRPAVFERGPEGVRRLLVGGRVQETDRVYVGLRHLGGDRTRFVVVTSTGDDFDRVEVEADTEAVLSAETLPPGTTLQLPFGEASPVAADGNRRILVAFIGPYDLRDWGQAEWEPDWPDGMTEVDP